MLGSYLKNYRVKYNLTQKQMAQKLQTSQGYYCKLETERVKPGMNMLNRIANVLKLQPSSVVKML